MRTTRPDLALLLVLLAIVVGIIVLIALHDSVPPELWAIGFGTLTAAGVAVPTAPTTTARVVIPPPPTGPAA